MTRVEILEMLNGCEVQSKSQKGVVGVYQEQFYKDGEELDLSDKQVKKLWKEYVKNELG
jgi:hypothetical protein